MGKDAPKLFVSVRNSISEGREHLMTMLNNADELQKCQLTKGKEKQGGNIGDNVCETFFFSMLCVVENVNMCIYHLRN